MQKKSFSIILLVLIYIIFALDLAAGPYFLYWKLWWFDMVLHFLGGLWITLGGYYIFSLSGYFKKISPDKKWVFVLPLLALVFAGSAWEIFEYLLGIIPIKGYVFDTCLDLAMDILGGGLACFFIAKNHALAEKWKNDRISKK